MDLPSSVIFLSGAGGGTPDFEIFRENDEDTTRFDAINYPQWRNCLAEGFSVETLIADLAAQIASRVPRGPIRIIGHSIGGHFGYAAALRLQAMGHQVAGFCAIDSFMIASPGPKAGWTSRALAEGVELLLKRRFSEFGCFARSKLWRALIRLTGRRLPQLLRPLSAASWLSSSLFFDPIFEKELSMRLLIQEAAPWVGALDDKPVALGVAAVLLRTNFTAGDDAAWQRRCPNLRIFEISGKHHNIFDTENIEALRQAFLAATPDWRI
jgi:thioesterase domain-containing protein